ncbi:MAG TPA: hypothetical protein VK528_12605 [Flavobacterium sp.]|nr:hypothetical protein [Flavobacterium sp.]
MKTKTTLSIVLLLFLFISGYAQQGPDFGAMAANKADASAVPESYNFSWQYTMEIQSGKGKAMTADYLLQKDAAYFGMRIRQAGDMLMIMDTKNKLSVTTFGKADRKCRWLPNFRIIPR